METTTGDTSRPTTKGELIERARRAHTALEQTIGGLTDAQMTAPGEGGWSIKDILAHITAWEQMLLRFHIGKKPFGEAAGMEAVNYETDEIDDINEAFYRRDKDKPVSEVLAAFRRSYEQVLATLEAMDEARLFEPYTPPGGDTTGLLADWIAGDTFDHYDEHRETIRSILQL